MLALVLAAVVIVGAQPGQRADLPAVEGTEFRHNGQHAHRADAPGANDVIEPLSALGQDGGRGQQFSIRVSTAVICFPTVRSSWRNSRRSAVLVHSSKRCCAAVRTSSSCVRHVTSATSWLSAAECGGVGAGLNTTPKAVNTAVSNGSVVQHRLFRVPKHRRRSAQPRGPSRCLKTGGFQHRRVQARDRNSIAKSMSYSLGILT